MLPFWATIANVTDGSRPPNQPLPMWDGKLIDV